MFSDAKKKILDMITKYFLFLAARFFFLSAQEKKACSQQHIR